MTKNVESFVFSKSSCNQKRKSNIALLQTAKRVLHTVKKVLLLHKLVSNVLRTSKTKQ